MNDFTKDELQYLFEAIDSDIECFNEPEIAYNVRDKIQSMIDSYVEREKNEQKRLSAEEFIFGKEK